MKKKVRNFKEGGFTAEQEEWLGGADRTDPYILARMPKAKEDTRQGITGPVEGLSPYGEEDERESFDEPEGPAKKPAKKRAKKPAAKTQAPKPDDAEMARQKDLKTKQALKGVYPEEYLGPGRLLKGLAKVVSRLAAGPKQGAESAVKRIAYDKKAAEPETRALPAPTKQSTYDKAGALAKRRAERKAAGEKAMREENAARYGITDTSAPGYEALRKANMARGGSVRKMAGGGKVSSASRRADGIAKRGHTRGKCV